MIDKKFLYVESQQIPLTQVPDGDLKANMIDPTTGNIYKGIVLQGCFADLSNTSPNNNKRYYDIPTYLEMAKILKKQIFSPKGVYGELEHPSGYAVNSNNVSHKLLDIWYDEKEKKVYGVLIILDTPKGRIAQEIIRSGGQLAVSARAAGEENPNADGTFDCKIKLLTTYDLVYHPGFSAAVLEFKQLNESQQFIQRISNEKKGFSGIIRSAELKNISNKFMEYISLNENQNCFYEWYLNDLQKLNEDKKPSKQNPPKPSKEEKIADKTDEAVLEYNEASDEDKIENKLKSAASKNLKEKENFFQEVKSSQQALKKKNSRQGNAYYQGSSGFVTETYFNGIDNNGFTY